MNNQLKNIFEFKKLISSNSIKKIFLISGKKSFYKTGANKLLLDNLKKKNIYLYLKKSYLPEFEELKKIINLKKNFDPDLIIAVGGGCVMDLAKISSVFNNVKDLRKKTINSDYEQKKTKVLAIPTTAGSGAEVTSNAVLYINKIKYSVEGNLIKPDYYLLLPQLLKSSNMVLDSTACFDAISQSIESMFSVKSNKQSIAFAEKALKILLKNSQNYLKKKKFEQFT